VQAHQVTPFLAFLKMTICPCKLALRLFQNDKPERQFTINQKYLNLTIKKFTDIVFFQLIDGVMSCPGASLIPWGLYHKTYYGRDLQFVPKH